MFVDDGLRILLVVTEDETVAALLLLVEVVAAAAAEMEVMVDMCQWHAVCCVLMEAGIVMVMAGQPTLLTRCSNNTLLAFT